MDFKVNDKVYMSLKGTKKWGEQLSNPKGIIGTITHIGDYIPEEDDGYLPISVQWNNGETNCYHPVHLIPDFDTYKEYKEIKKDKPMTELDKQIQYMELMTEKKEEKKKDTSHIEDYKVMEYKVFIDPYKEDMDSKLKELIKKAPLVLQSSKRMPTLDSMAQLKRPVRKVGYTSYKPTLRF